jgi:hypothetical protein
MPETDFEAEILENEIVIAHVAEGHVYHFPILTNGTVSLHGSRIEPNPQSKREARGSFSIPTTLLVPRLDDRRYRSSLPLQFDFYISWNVLSTGRLGGGLV